jgi:hypothetical protein
MTGGRKMADLKRQALDLLTKPAGLGVLGTADTGGHPNIAYLSSVRVLEGDTVMIGFGDNHSLSNLRENPAAVYFAIETVPITAMDTPGFRIYMNRKEIVSEGPLFDEIRAFIRERAGDQAASMTVAAVTFDVTNVRPMIDMG